jgi:L-2-hydroxycarboxylate dehydrogenase (NAD+)
MKVKITEIRKALEGALIRHGTPKEEAKIIADEYLEGELQGKTSHGLMAFPSLIKKLTGKRKKIKIFKKTNALVFLDANENIGAFVGEKAADLAIKMARKEGLALILIKNMTTWLRPGTIAKKIADRDYIALVVNNGGKPMIAPPGGYEPVIGTNPIGIGIPTAKEPFLADMATSVRAWGEVRKAEKTGKDLPKNSYYDNQGRFAVKAQDAYSALPSGGYKGFALGFLIEILTGSLVGQLMGPQQMKGDYRILTRGGFILVIDPRKITRLGEFKKANTNLVKEVKKSKKLKGVKEILIPGERAMKTRKENIKRGSLEVDDKLWAEIKK